MMSHFLLHYAAIFILIGIFAGLMAGILGIGGGLVVVPSLVFFFQSTHLIPDSITMQVAVGTSLAVMIITSLAAIRAHYKLSGLLWPVFHKLWPGLISGTLAGALITAWIPTHYLRMFFAIFLFLVGLKLLTDAHVSRPEQFPKNWINRLITFGIGLISGLLGVGGGILIIPYVTYCGIELRKIASVSNLCTFTVGLIGTLVVLVTGRLATAAIPYATGFVYWPAVLLIAIPSSLTAPWGAKLNYKLPLHQLKYGFIVLLILTAIEMLV